MRFAEFFAGIGLMREALERIGFECAFANDFDPKKTEMYRARFGDGDDLRLCDIHDVRAEDIPDVDLATASFPCTDLSLAGSRAGISGPQSSAVWAFIEILRGMGRRRPRVVLLENVTGLISASGGADLRELLVSLSDLGYGLDLHVVDAKHFVPQSRKRLFLIGTLQSQPSGDELPEIVTSQSRPTTLVNFIRGNRDLPFDLRPMPPLESTVKSLSEVLEDLPADDRRWWSASRTAKLLSQMAPASRFAFSERISGGEVSVGAGFRRVREGKTRFEARFDGLGGCLRTPKGGSARQILIFAGKGEVRFRLLTAREASRMMGADEFPLTVSESQALFGFGDAVCVPAVEYVGQFGVLPRLCLPAGLEPSPSEPVRVLASAL